MARNKKKTQKDDPAWENRVLCSDESCIGTIGPDRRCRECGRVYEGQLPPGFDDYAAADSGEGSADEKRIEVGLDTETDTDDTDPEDREDTSPEDDWENRILCSDESCIGVIGPDGRCKDCGKPYQR